VEKSVTRVCEAAKPVLVALGCEVANDEPDLDGVDELFQTLRARGYAAGHRRDLERHRSLLKDTVVWNIERGLALTADDDARAAAIKTALDARVAAFFERYDFLALPVVQVAPFAVETQWVREIEGVAMPTYIDWMASCYAISCTGLPAVSVPCGFTPQGLPIGLQIVGRRNRDFEVLQLAHAFEQATRHALRRPPLAVSTA
jgi:amidase